MKKILAVVLALVIAFSALSMFALAKEEKTVPLVVLQGYSGPDLAYVDENGEYIIDEETGEVKLAWGLDLGALVTDLIIALPKVATGSVIDNDGLAKAWLPVLKEHLAPLGRTETGESKENLLPYPSGAANTQVSAMYENGTEEFIGEHKFSAVAVEKYGAENVFSFTFDWRKSQLDYAEALDEYIQDVKEITGSDKVDIMGLSHGGQYGTTYLYYYGDKGDVRNAILANPATWGTTFIGSVFTGEYIDLDAQNLMLWCQYFFDFEEDFTRIFDYVTLEQLVGALNVILQDRDFIERASHFGSLLDFIPPESFDEAIDFLGLSAEKNGKLYNDTVKLHQEFMAGDNLANKLAELRENGTKIGHIVGVGYESITGDNYNGDLVIDAHLSSGSYCTPLGTTFPDGYVQQNTNCDNPNHYHLSPEQNLDASTGFSPDHTWYAIGQAHGQYFNDPYTRQILFEFLLGDLENVYSDDRYPQFHYTEKHSDSVYVRFNNTDTGYHSSADTQLIVENLSKTSKLHILKMYVEGAQVDYEIKRNTVLDVGEKITVDVSNISPETANKPFQIVVKFYLEDNPNTYSEKIFNFVAMSDEEMEKYPHLAVVGEGEKPVPSPDEKPVPSPDEKPTVPATPEEPTTPDEPSTDNNDVSTDVNIPNTTTKQPIAVGVASVICGFAVLSTGVLLKKKKENE